MPCWRPTVGWPGVPKNLFRLRSHGAKRVWIHSFCATATDFSRHGPNGSLGRHTGGGVGLTVKNRGSPKAEIDKFFLGLALIG
jgi:hypothetical protein